MDINNLTNTEADAIFAALTMHRSAFIAAMARAALRSSAEVAEDMYLEDHEVPTDVGSIRNMAVGMFEGSFEEFEGALIKEIKDVPVDMRTKRELTITLEF